MEIENKSFHPGDVAYVIIRNPHVQGVANVQQAAVVNHPNRPNELALFMYETYYPLSEEVAIYQTEHEAEVAFQQAFGNTEVEGYDG
ncbi:transcriptional regulator SplA domain-containing protein [Paraliobacillus sp. JSM ZJ581]|uniref:transcriptional regulator SplA domain-containing protein n=1 Tax=Paraliobacillus sp. JSM ZJ581 TaxID=3342118 RepID=UPI0035A9A696